VDIAAGSGHSANPYAPPAPTESAGRKRRTFRRDEGNYATGFAVGLLFALLGLIVMHFTARPATKRGALHGVLARFTLTALVVLLSTLNGW
jgi:hypothetical protein